MDNNNLNNTMEVKVGQLLGYLPRSYKYPGVRYLRVNVILTTIKSSLEETWWRVITLS